MTFPTHLNPWYVVQRIATLDRDTSSDAYEYWSSDGEGSDMWRTNPHQAMLFMNLSSAARVADAEAAEVRVLYNKDGLHEFRPREFDQ